MLGFSPPTQGSTTVFGESSLELSAAAKARIGFVPQHDELLGVLSGKQLLAIVAAFHADWRRRAHRPLGRGVGRAARPAHFHTVRRRAAEARPCSPRSATSRTCSCSTSPSRASTRSRGRQFLHELFAIAESTARAVLFSSHIVSDLERAASKVWIVKDGRLHWQGEIDALKESVVRLQIRARKPLPSDLGVPNALAARVDGNVAQVTVASWQPQSADALGRRLDATVEVEPLALEEIFLELHR